MCIIMLSYIEIVNTMRKIAHRGVQMVRDGKRELQGRDKTNTLVQ